MSRKNSLKRFLSGITAVSVCLGSFTFTAAADDEPAGTQSDGQTATIVYEKQKTYSEYHDEIADAPRPRTTNIEGDPLTYVDCGDGAEVEVGSYEGRDNVVIWKNEDGTVN